MAVALQNGHVRHQHSVVERRGGLAHTAAHALFQLVAGVLRRGHEAAALGARADDGVEVGGVAGIDHVAVEETQRLAHVAAAGSAAEGHVRGELRHHLHLHVVGGDGGLHFLHGQDGVPRAGEDQRFQVLPGLVLVQLKAGLGGGDDYRLLLRHGHLRVHRGHVHGVGQGVDVGVQGLLVVGDFAVELRGDRLQVFLQLPQRVPIPHVAQVPGPFHLGIVVHPDVEIRGGEAPGLAVVGEGVGAVHPLAAGLLHHGIALVPGEAGHADAVDVDVVHESLFAAANGRAHQLHHAEHHQRQHHGAQRQPHLGRDALPALLPGGGLARRGLLGCSLAGGLPVRRALGRRAAGRAVCRRGRTRRAPLGGGMDGSPSVLSILHARHLTCSNIRSNLSPRGNSPGFHRAVFSQPVDIFRRPHYSTTTRPL